MTITTPIPSSHRIVTRSDLDKVLDSADKVSDFYFGTQEPVKANIQNKNYTILNRSLDEGEIRQIIYVLGDEATGMYDGILSQARPRFRSYTTKTTGMRYRVVIVRLTGKRQSKIRIVMRRLDTEPWELNSLRIPPNFINVIMNKKPGLTIIAGATGSGKTTLLSGGLRAIVSSDFKDPHLVTIEDPVEFLYDDVAALHAVTSSMEVGEACKDFADGLRAAVRMHPTHILVGEIRDAETATTCIAAARSGHKVFTTIHTSSVAEIFSRWSDFYPESGKRRAITDLASVLDYALYQTLEQTENGFGPVQESLDFTQFSRPDLVSTLVGGIDDIYSTVHEIVSEFGITYDADWAKLNPSTHKVISDAL